MKNIKQKIEQRGSEMSDAREFLHIHRFVAVCRRQWPGATIVLRPNQDGAPTGANAPTIPNPHPEKSP
jgi:hypothetical protein